MNCRLSSLRLRKVISQTSNCTPRRASCSTRSSYLPPFLSLTPFIRKSTPRACATTMIFAVGSTSRWLLILRRPFDACSRPSLRWYTTLSCALPPPVAAYAATATNSADAPTTTDRLMAFMAPPMNLLVPRQSRRQGVVVPGGRRAVQRREKAVAILAGFLGRIHRRVGVLHEGGRIRGVVWKQADADARGHPRFSAARQRVGPQCVIQQFAVDAFNRGGVCDFLEDHEEFVAAEPRDEIGRPQLGAQAPRHFHEELVADVMAVGVVDLLEAVQVDERAGEPRAVAPRALDGLLQGRGEAGTVGKPGERIAVSERFDPLAHERGFSDIAAHAAVPAERPVGSEPRLAGQREIPRDPVGQGPRELEVAERNVAVHACLVFRPLRRVGTQRGNLP